MNTEPNSEVPIRVVKKKSGHAAHHGGAWKVAYADFVTAMMALFIVLWIVGQSKQVKQYIAAYFRDPGAFFENTKGGGMFQGSNMAAQEQSIDEMIKREQKKLEEMGKEILSSISADPTLKELLKQVKIQIVDEGLRIELMESTTSYFFDIGTSVLKPEAVRLLKIIGSEVRTRPNNIIIEGHTDSRPYERLDGYSNYELSVDRANSARRVLMGTGLRPRQVIEIRGYADLQLRDAANPYDVTNRRVSIIICHLRTRVK